jgi:hypothetical protein
LIFNKCTSLFLQISELCSLERTEYIKSVTNKTWDHMLGTIRMGLLTKRGKKYNSFLNWLSNSSCKWHDWNYQLALQSAESIFLHLRKLSKWDLLSKARGFVNKKLDEVLYPVANHFSRALFLFHLLNYSVIDRQLPSLLRFASCYLLRKSDHDNTSLKTQSHY